ncbi:ABC transporter substrate-binding protein [Embleya hyalina]|uniref:Lipoprotein n=1 Tax=Embleya hyalina TaxID=516124 RepID=A0A401YKT2_9ACTN|nr:ABC transporter substrate-binding protein [Embleya hyalina]GCD95217.1 lipoprotein [Embleya hyalina]
MRLRNGVRVGAALAALVLAATACSTKGDDDEKDKRSGGVKSGPGVTDTTITLGALTDLSGPYAPLGKSIVNAQQLYVDEINAQGGICGRKLAITVRDHGYDVQKAVAAYTEIKGGVAGFPQVIGSAVVTALQDSLKQDRILTFPQAWPATLLNRPEIQIVGTTYDIDMINGMDFLAQAAQLKSGDKVGHVYFEGEYGENALAGAKFAAGKLGAQIVEQKIKATDTDLTAQIAALRGAGVKAILISAGPTQTATLVGFGAVAGLRVPVLTSAPGFHPQVMASAAAGALEQLLYVVSAAPAIGADIPAVKKLAADYKAKYPDGTLDQGVISGYNAMKIFGEDLKAACAAKDLSHAGIIAAHRQQKQMDTGLGTPEDFSDVTRPATYKSYILKPSKAAPGNLVVAKDAYEVPAAREYRLPAAG